MLKSQKIILAAIAFVVLMVLVFILMKPKPPPPVKLPNPNGYDDLAKAGQMLRGEVPICFGEVEDEWWDDDCLEKARSFIQENSEALDLARLGLSRESRLPFEYIQSFNPKHYSELGGLKKLGRTLAAEGKVAERENRTAAAIQSYLDVARLYGKIRGGVMIDASFGISLEALGLRSLRKLSNIMTREQRQEIINTLTELYSNRDSLGEIVTNERTFVRNAWSLRDQLNDLIEFRSRRQAVRRLEMKLKFQQSSLGLFLVDLAVRNYKSDNGRPPKTLQELVPKYLPFLPKDDFSGKDFIYRPSTNGYEVYGVGYDGIDDGGKPLTRTGVDSLGDMLPNSRY